MPAAAPASPSIAAPITPSWRTSSALPTRDSGQVLSQQGSSPPLANSCAGGPSRRPCVPVPSRGRDGDGKADISAGGGTTSTVRIYLATDLSGTPSSQFDPFAGFLGGVNVG